MFANWPGGKKTPELVSGCVVKHVTRNTIQESRKKKNMLNKIIAEKPWNLIRALFNRKSSSAEIISTDTAMRTILGTFDNISDYFFSSNICIVLYRQNVLT